MLLYVSSDICGVLPELTFHYTVKRIVVKEPVLVLFPPTEGTAVRTLVILPPLLPVQ